MVLRTRITACLPVAITSAATAMLLAAGVAFGQTSSSTGPAGPSANLVLVGTSTGEPEKDSLAFAAPPPQTCVVPRFSERPQPVGTVTGDPERDSFGFVIVGADPCPATPQPQ